MSEQKIAEFVESNKAWINEKLSFQQRRKENSDRISKMENQLREAAHRTIPELVYYYSEMMKLYPTSVKITSAEKRFGSCSGKNGLCFSWRLMAYPREAVDYVVVHELAHIKYHNHSREFYSLIAKYMPDYKIRQRILKNIICEDLTNTYL